MGKINYLNQKINTNLELGVPVGFSEMSSNSLLVNLQKGQLNKVVVYPRIGNEYCESSREIQGVVTATNIVGQIFKASKNNITALSLTLESASGILLDNFESYANDAAIQSVWVETGNVASVETTIVKSGSQAMSLLGSSVNDEWINTVPSIDYTDYTGSFDA